MWLTAVAVQGIGLGMAGVDRPSDKERIKSWLHEALPASVHTTICNDAVIALASGTKGKLFGVVVISGTGTISVGFDEHGNTKRAAGWGCAPSPTRRNPHPGAVRCWATTAAATPSPRRSSRPS